MKTSKYIIALSILAAAISCSKNEEPAELQAPEEDLVTITATLPDGDIVKGGALKTSLSWTWNSGDKITVIGETTETFTIKPGFTPKKAEFVGKAVQGTSFTILYPGEDAATADWSAQTQKGNDNLDHLCYAASLNGVDDYMSFSFDSEWAESHGGSLKQTGVLQLNLEIPAEITEPTQVSLSADEELFYSSNDENSKTNKISLALSDCSISDRNLVAWITTAWNDVTVAEGTTLYVTVDGNSKSLSRDVLFTKEASLLTGAVNVFTLKGEGWADETVNAHYAGGKGTKASPWIIETKEQMLCMAGDLVEGSVRYYKMNADVDLTGEAWVPLNNADPYTKSIVFDGNGKTITGLTVSGAEYGSFAGVLYGSISNVTFEGANITGNGSNAGVVAGYLGTGEKAGECTGVTVNNATVTAEGGNIGGFAGQMAAVATISNCHVTGTNTISQTGTASNCSAAAFIGNVSAAATITGCTAKADVSNEASYYTGGFIGQIGAAVAANVSECAFLGGNITANRNSAKNSPVAGFVGRVTKSAGANFYKCYVDGAVITAKTSGRVGGFVGDASNNNTFTSCYVKNSSISASMHSAGFCGVFYCTASKCYVESTTITANNTNNGGFVGYPEGATISDCYVASDVTVNGGSYNCTGGFLGICKGNNTITNCFEAATVNGTAAQIGAFIGYVDVAPLSITKCIAWNSTLGFHGGVKSEGLDAKITGNYTGTEGTISSQASTLGWSTDVWDLSGDTPKLK